MSTTTVRGEHAFVEHAARTDTDASARGVSDSARNVTAPQGPLARATSRHVRSLRPWASMLYLVNPTQSVALLVTVMVVPLHTPYAPRLHNTPYVGVNRGKLHMAGVSYQITAALATRNRMSIRSSLDIVCVSERHLQMLYNSTITQPLYNSDAYVSALRGYALHRIEFMAHTYARLGPTEAPRCGASDKGAEVGMRVEGCRSPEVV